VIVTEYYAIRESWFKGRLVAAPGLSGPHRVDWLYGVHGVAMNGEGLGLDGRYYHFAGPYGIGWVSRSGGATTPCWNGVWTGGRPAWLAFGWRTRSGAVTYPLAKSGWSNGRPAGFVPPSSALRFGPGHARTLPFWHAVATDPKVIPYGSRVFLPAYCDTPAHGWFKQRTRAPVAPGGTTYMRKSAGHWWSNHRPSTSTCIALGGGQLKISINCLAVSETYTNHADMRGTVERVTGTYFTNQGFTQGGNAFISVDDNGGAPLDRLGVQSSSSGGQSACGSAFDFPIAHGNISVHDAEPH
jgi:hypothetical protein